MRYPVFFYDVAGLLANPREDRGFNFVLIVIGEGDEQ
jgi:hypothetical protein